MEQNERDETETKETNDNEDNGDNEDNEDNGDNLKEEIGDDEGEERDKDKDNCLISLSVGPKHFDILKLIGEGAFGKVFLVRNRINKQLYAMKVISKRLIKKKNQVTYIRSEKEILTKIEHPFIVSLKFAFHSEKKLFLVMDFLGGGELFFHLRRRGLILEKEARFYLAEMILAIEFLHSMNIVHRDLKPENVLLGVDGHVSLTDFGLAKEIGFDSNVRTLCGTSEYMAPEMLTRNGYGKAVDWWSLGALLFEMLSGKPPFQAKTQVELDRMIMTEKLQCPTYLSANTHSLLKGMLQKDPSKRLGASKATMFELGGTAALKQHPFFIGIDWQSVYNKQLPPPFVMNVNGDEDVSNFHEGFTHQVISYSIVEDTLSPLMVTPVEERSRATSIDNFDDFSYTDPKFAVTENQINEFQEQLVNKIKSYEKKKIKKAKAEEAKIKKMAEEAALQELKRIEEEKKALERKRLEEEMKKREDEQRELLQQLEYKKSLRNSYEQYNESLTSIQKKIKRLKKKLRDILDLETKLSTSSTTPSEEQISKLQKKQEVSDDIAEAEEEEEKLLEQATTPEFQEMLKNIEDLNIANDSTIDSTTSSITNVITTTYVKDVQSISSGNIESIQNNSIIISNNNDKKTKDIMKNNNNKNNNNNGNDNNSKDKVNKTTDVITKNDNQNLEWTTIKSKPKQKKEKEIIPNQGKKK